jgi:hypothetical protein
MTKLWIRAYQLLVVFCSALMAATAAISAETNYTLKSPDNRIEVQIHVANKITYDVSLNGKALVKDSSLSLNLEGKTLGESPQVKSTKKVARTACWSRW